MNENAQLYLASYRFCGLETVVVGVFTDRSEAASLAAQAMKADPEYGGLNSWATVTPVTLDTARISGFEPEDALVPV